MKTVYESKPVKQLNTFYATILHQNRFQQKVHWQLTQFVETLWKGVLEKNPIIAIEIGNHHPTLVGKSMDTILNASLTFADCQTTIARAYGFQDWYQVAKLVYITFDELFEEAVDAVVNGNLEVLQTILQSHPHFVHQRSPYGHRAGLIHYIAANGVEIWRQKIPINIIPITKCLIEYGADPHMTSNIYGGQGNLLGLIQSSAHPWDAGVGKVLIAFLKPFF